MDSDRSAEALGALDMDTPADPATPLKEVYQAFLDDLDKEGLKQTTIDRYR